VEVCRKLLKVTGGLYLVLLAAYDAVLRIRKILAHGEFMSKDLH